MATPELGTASYGSLGTFSAVYRPTRRKKMLSIFLAIAGILLCAALVSLGNTHLLGIHLTDRSSELLVTKPATKTDKSVVSPSRANVLPGYVENWGNQTPTAMIYARNSPVTDGVVDFYLNFPVGSRKLHAPKWFMGIPVRRNRAAALKQVESALLDGQIKQFPATSTTSHNPNRKLLGLLGSVKKFGKKPTPGKVTANGATSANPSTNRPVGKAAANLGKSTQSGSISKNEIGSSSAAPQREVDCCLPACALGRLPFEFNPKGCVTCTNQIEKNQCTSVTLGTLQWAVCKRLVGKPIRKGDIVKPLFDPATCKVGSARTPLPPSPPLPVPSCAIDKNTKFAGCSACSDPTQFPAVDGRICKDILSKSKPEVGVTVVIRSDSLRDPNPPAPPPPPPPAPIQSKSSGSSNFGKSSFSKTPSKMCSHDPTKLNGNGQGCTTCQGRIKTAATTDLPGNDYWACSQCRDKGICNFKCKQNLTTKVWECTQGNSGPVSPPPLQREPECVADTRMIWKSYSNQMRCQGYMCKSAGLQPSGEFGPLKYPKANGYPKTLDAKTCCPFVAQGLTPASCHQMFGCEVPLTMPNGKTEWTLRDQVKSCKNFFCFQGVSSPAEWAQKQGDSKFADGRNKGRSACCAKLLASVPDGKESWCPIPIVDPNCKGTDCKPVVAMDEEQCKDFLCQQTPMISNVGDSYALWLENQHSSGSRRLLQTAVAPKTISSSPATPNAPSASVVASKSQSELDPNVGQCVRTLQLTGIESWQTNPHCVKEEDEKQEEEEVNVEEEVHEKQEHEEKSGGEEVKTSGSEGEAGHEVAKEEHEGEKEEEAEVEHEPEIEKEEIPESECDEENGPENLPLLPGANVLGYTYDPVFGLDGCNFDRCVMRPFIKFSYKDCKVVETPAGQFKVPDQIYAFNLFETSAQTHIYENEKEEHKADQVSAHIEGSYGCFSASAHMDRSTSGDSSSKQHIAVRKIDVHLYRLTLLNTKSFDSLRPEFLDAFKLLPARFEDNVHDYIQFLRDWGRYVATSGTFGGSVEIRMKFFSASSASKEDFSAGVEMSVDVGLFSASGGVSGGYSNEAKSVDNNNEISIDSSGGDPAVASVISDVKSAQEMNFREDLQMWLESLPKYPRLVEDWPILAVMTQFIPNSPSEDGAFDPFTRNQGLLQAMRILHEDGATSLFDKRTCYPPLPSSDVKQLPVSIPMPAPKVRIFQHCNYGGATLALAPGEYPHLQNPGGYNFERQISSLQIQKGTSVIMYSRPNFQGETLVLSADSACLVGQNFNDVAQSMKIIAGSGEIQDTGNKRKRKPLPSGRTSIAFNDFDRMHVGQCLTFVAETAGDIDVYLFSSPVSQTDAYSFQVGIKDVKFEKGLYAMASLIKKSSDTNALAFGQASLPQNVWFCVYPDSEDSTATVFSYGRGSYTLFEHVEKDPVLINYFALDCTKASTYRSIVVIKASRWLESVNPYNRVCAIVNCQKVQPSESESGVCACEQCAYGYQPYNNNQECIVADQCPAQFGCLSANPPDCACEECCCGLSYDPVTQNCVNANLMWKSGASVEDNIAIVGTHGESQTVILRQASHTFFNMNLPLWFGCPYVFYLLQWCKYTPAQTLDVASMTNKMETKFQAGSSYRLKKLMLACTSTSVQNIRLSYDASAPALGFIDYDSTHLLTKSDTAGKFDFSIYDNLRKSVQANPLFSASGFLNLDEVKLEEVTLGSMAKKTGNALQDMFKFMVEGAQQFAKGVDQAVKNGVKVVEDIKNKAVEVVNDLKAKTEEIIKVADGEFKKFMKVAEKAYKDVVSVVQKASQGAIDFIAQNADLLRTVSGVVGGIGSGLVTALPQLMNLIPACQAWCGIVVAAVGNAAVGAATMVSNGVIDMAVNSKKSGKNPLDFLSKDLKDIPGEIMNIAGPVLDKAMKNVNVNDIMQFANSSSSSNLLKSVVSGGFNNIKDIFNDPGLQKLGGDVAGNLLNQGASLMGNLPIGDIASTGLKAVSPMLDKVLPGAGSVLETASKHILPGLGNLLGGLLGGKKRSLLSAHDEAPDIHGHFSNLCFLGICPSHIANFAQNVATSANNAFQAVSSGITQAGQAIKASVSGTVEALGNVHKAVAGTLDQALGTKVFSQASNAVHDFVGGGIKNAVNGIVDGGTSAIVGAMKTINDRVSDIFDPNKAKREYMNSQEYKDKMAAKAIFATFSTKLDLPSNMPKYLTDSLVQWIIGEMKVTPLRRQPFLTNLNADNQCVSQNAPETCSEQDIKCIVLANKCFLDDEGCVRAALETVSTAALEKYAAANHLDFAGSSYGRYIRVSAPNCKKRLSVLSSRASRLLLQSNEESELADSEPVQDDEDPTVDADTLFAQQPPLVYGLTSKFWKQPQLISSDANHQDRIQNGRRLTRGMRIVSPLGQCKAEVQNDGNFVVYKNGNQWVWDTKTSDIYVIYLKPDGNLCAYRADGSIAWGCISSGSNAYLAMQDDCNLVLYKDNGKGVSWSTGTSQLVNINLFSKLNVPQSAGDRSILSDVRGTVFRAAKPDFIGQVPNLNFQSSDKAFAGSPFISDFLAQFSGNIFVPLTGTWTFFLTSDDGSRLYIDGSQVVDNDGFHGMVEVSGSAVLSRGMHTIDVSFFQGGFGSGLTLAWSGPSTKKEIINKEFFLLNSNDVPLSLPRDAGCKLDNTLQISQIAVFDPFGTNVALNAPCDTANPFISDRLIPYLPAGPQNTYPSLASCARAVDGRLANREGSEIFQSTEPDSDTVTFDLGKNVLIKRIMYWNRKDCCQSMIAGATLEVLNEVGDVVNTEVFTDKLVQAFNFPVSQSRATLFTECSYGGDQFAIGPGNYKLAMMQIPAGSLSSIKLPQDLEIKLFAGDSFNGKSTPWIQADVPCLDGFQFNDQTGSVQVRERSKLNSVNSNEVVFYDNCDFKGVSMTLIPGTYTASEMSLTRNSIMSVKVPAELEVQLYSFDNLGGRSSGWLQRSYTCLTDIDFSRTTVSLQIRKRTKAKKRSLLSKEEHRKQLIETVLSHAGQYAYYMPKNGDSESAKQALHLAVKMAHHGALVIAESHQHHREMLASIAKWVPHQYVLSALKMDLEQNSATSAFAHTAVDRVHKSLFTQLTEIADTTAQNSLNLLDQMVVNILGEAYAPVTLPAPCFSRDLIMSYLPSNLQSGIETWLEMNKYSWIQEIRVDSVDALLRDPKVAQADKYAISSMSFKVSQYKVPGESTNENYYLVRGIETRYQKVPSFGGPGDSITTFIGKSQPDADDPVAITDCKPVNLDEGEFVISMAVVIIPEGLGGISSVITNKREIPIKCGQKPSTSTDMVSDDGVVWINCDVGYDVVGIGGKFDSRAMRTVELQCSPTSQADRVQFLGVYSYSFKTNEFFNGISGDYGSGYRSGFWAAGREVGITRKLSKDSSDGWNLRIWTNRVPPISPVTGVPPVDVKASSLGYSFEKEISDRYLKISESDSLTKAMAPPTDAKWYFDSSGQQYTDINTLTFVENTKDGSIRGVYVDYSARQDLYSGYILNSESSYKDLRIKNLKLQRNEYWTGLKVGLDQATGAVSCITGVKTSIREYGILCGSRETVCLKKAGWIECPSNAPMMVALQEDFNSNNQLIGLMPICASAKATRFEVDEFTVMFEEDEYMTKLWMQQGMWLDSIPGLSTNKRIIPLQCGLRNGQPESVKTLTVPTQFMDKQIKKGQAAIGMAVEVTVSDQFGVYADKEAVTALGDFQKKMDATPETSQNLANLVNTATRGKGPGPSILRLKLQALTFDADPQSAIIMEAPEEAGRSRIPDFEASGVYIEPTFDMAFDFYKPRLGQFHQISVLQFQCERAKSTAKDFWMPWFELSFTSGDKYAQGEKSTGRLAVTKSLSLSSEEYMIRIELSSNKDKGYTITTIKTNKKVYNFKCGATTIALDVPPRAKDLIIGFAGNLQTGADGTYFTNLQALHLKLNAFADEPADLKLNQ